MAKDPKFEVGDKVKGSSTFSGLKGKVIDTSETGFGLRYALVKQKDGSTQNARTIYLSRRG